MDNCCITSTLGSCIDFDITYADESGAPENITDSVFDVYKASKPAFLDAVISITDPLTGAVHLHLSADNSAKLSSGNINWFRIRRTMPDGCAQVSEQIWVNMV